MNVTIHPSNINGTITAPASKSSMQRACAAAMLNKGETIIHNAGKSNDDKAALDVIQKLGASVQIDNEELIINNSSNLNPSSIINCGESGLGIRMFTPIAALSKNEITITGEGSLLKRPMHFFDEIFPQLKVFIQSNNGHLPIKIKGPLQPADITIDGSLSSQFLTGLLFAYGKAVTKTTTISVTNLKSIPYIDLTLSVMKHFGYSVVNNNYESFTINPINQLTNKQINYTVEGDWSSASFLLVAGAIAGNIVVTGLDVFSTQADKNILQALMSCGARMSIEEKQISINSTLKDDYKAFHFNATDCPDLFPPLVALASFCNGKSVIEGVSRLAHKESNRALTLQTEFAKLGVEIVLQDDLMIIDGGGEIKGATISSHNDHRIAMAAAVVALVANEKIEIENAEAIKKSYPNFYEDLKKNGVNLSINRTV